METQAKATLADSLLIPAANDAPLPQKPTPRPILVFQKSAASTVRKRPHKQRPRRGGKKYSVEQAFDYDYGPTATHAHDALNEERAIRAVAFLLTYCSKHGNEKLDGNTANGLARILELNAARSGKRGAQ